MSWLFVLWTGAKGAMQRIQNYMNICRWENLIVAVDLPSIREEVTDGKDILLAKPDDPKSLAEKIGHVLENPDFARRLADNAYRLADEFSWEKRAARLSEVFNIVYEKSREK